MEDRLRAVLDVVEDLQEIRGPMGAQALDLFESEGGLSEPMARWALSTVCGRYTPEALRGCIRTDLSGGVAALMLARSVPTAPLRALVLLLLRGARAVWARPSRSQPSFTRLLIQAMSKRGLPVHLVEALEPTQFLRGAGSNGVTHLVAYGNDDTLAAMAQLLPRGVRMEGHGHGFGLGLVVGGARIVEEGAARVARDVALYDQHGCLSPQTVLVEAAHAPGFARALANALKALEDELPRGPVDAGRAVAIHQWQGAMAAVAEEFHRGPTYGVALLEHTRIIGSPGGRNIAVVPMKSWEKAWSAVGSELSALTCLGVHGAPLERQALGLPLAAQPRVVQAGFMQDPPLDGPEDPRPALRNQPASAARGDW